MLCGKSDLGGVLKLVGGAKGAPGDRLRLAVIWLLAYDGEHEKPFVWLLAYDGEHGKPFGWLLAYDSEHGKPFVWLLAYDGKRGKPFVWLPSKLRMHV